MGGHPRSDFHPPVPYPVACRPQAWTSGTTLHLLQAILGLQPDALNGALKIERVRLPFWLQQVSIEGMAVGGANVNLFFDSRGHETEVSFDVRGDLQVQIR
jgi:glycogen debranching enzyme